MPVIGTAGHVDHGKSTLVAALTGRDPDRWAEEKQRGLTIDLGFAWTTIGRREVSFVDVPGHERYAKNMLAGIEAIDVALFVVAADEGWMPQSEEHLAVLDLLDVSRGVVALTKTDRVDDDLLELATLEVSEHLEGTSLQSAPIIPVSAAKAEGIDTLAQALEAALESVPAADSDRPRLWIDRAFSIEGAGTVVTGTLLGGSVAVGDSVLVWPGDHSARVRGIQSHERTLEIAVPHQRTALNLSGADLHDIERGSMLGREGEWRLSSKVAAQIRRARFADELTNRGAYHLHLGSGAWPIRLRMLAADVAILDLPSALPLEMGDRFVIRDTGRRLVVGGGRIIDPSPARPRLLVREVDGQRAADRLLASLGDGPDERASSLLELRGDSSLDDLSAESGGGRPIGAVSVGVRCFSRTLADDLTARLVAETKAFHDSYPLRPGLPAAESVESRRLRPEDVQALAARSEVLVVESGVIRHASFTGKRTDEQEASWRGARSTLERLGLEHAPRTVDLDLDRELLQSLVRSGELVAVAEFAFLPDHLDTILGHIRSFREPFTVSEFKDRAGISRKYAIPLMEWADARGHTVRMGDRRRVRDRS